MEPIELCALYSLRVRIEFYDELRDYVLLIRGLQCALAAAQCIVISLVYLFVGVWVGLLPR